MPLVTKNKVVEVLEALKELGISKPPKHTDVCPWCRAELAREREAKMTPEKKAQQRAKRAEQRAKRTAQMTPEQKEMERAKRAEQRAKRALQHNAQ